MNPLPSATDFALGITDVEKVYGAHRALYPLSMTVRSGEFLAIVGPSGSGKSTLLKIIGGFETPTGGRLLMDGADITHQPPAERPTRMVFQRLALFPHMSVADNIGYPLKLRGEAPDAILDRALELMALMHLNASYADRLPSQLSGGEQQRVALARALISSPRILLLDEPLSALDAKLKKDLQAELRSLHRALGVTFVHVTHDLEEAMILADRICVMRHGRIEQIGRPQDIYYRPRTAFVAQFIGETNLLPARVSHRQDLAHLELTIGDQTLGAVMHEDQVEESVGEGAVLAMVRPEHIHIIEGGDDTAGDQGVLTITARVAEVFDRGPVTQYRTMVAGASVPIVFEVHGSRDPLHKVGEVITLGIPAGEVFVLQADAT